MQSGYIHLTEYQSGQLLNTHEKLKDFITNIFQKMSMVLIRKTQLMKIECIIHCS